MHNCDVDNKSNLAQRCGVTLDKISAQCNPTDKTSESKLISEMNKQDNERNDDLIKSEMHEAEHTQCDKCVTEHHLRRSQKYEAVEQNITKERSSKENTLQLTEDAVGKQKINDAINYKKICDCMSLNDPLDVVNLSLKHEDITGEISNDIEQDFVMISMDDANKCLQYSNHTEYEKLKELTFSNTPPLYNDRSNEVNQELNSNDKPKILKVSSGVPVQVHHRDSEKIKPETYNGQNINCNVFSVKRQGRDYPTRSQTHETSEKQCIKERKPSTDEITLKLNEPRINNQEAVQWNCDCVYPDVSPNAVSISFINEAAMAKILNEAEKSFVVTKTEDAEHDSVDKTKVLEFSSGARDNQNPLEADKIKPNTCNEDLKVKPEASSQCNKPVTEHERTESNFTHESGEQSNAQVRKSESDKSHSVSEKPPYNYRHINHTVQYNANRQLIYPSSSGDAINIPFIDEYRSASSFNETEQDAGNVRNRVPEEEFKGDTLEEFYEIPDIKTLRDSLEYFGLHSHLDELERSLEDARRNVKNKANHEKCFHRIDKEIQKLSYIYHPDKVGKRGSVEEVIAQKLQTALNTTRTVLRLLNAAFLEDISVDHKFGYYTHLNICSLCNEDEMKYQIYEVMFKIGLISRIKQENIISEIRKFLTESQNCVRSYLKNTNDFETFKKHRDLALLRLKYCIEGFEMLCMEIDNVKEECKLEEDDKNMKDLLEKIENEKLRDLRVIKLLEKTAKSSLNGRYQFFSTREDMDPYFVLPLVCYTNVILMCNQMAKKESFWDYMAFRAKHIAPNHYTILYPDHIVEYRKSHYWKDLEYLQNPYYLVSYYSGNKHYGEKVLQIVRKKRGGESEIDKYDIKIEFYSCINKSSELMESKFKIEDYNEIIMSNICVADLKNCMTMMTEFQKKQKEVSKSINEIQKKTEKISEKVDKVMEETEERKRKISELLEKRH